MVEARLNRLVMEELGLLTLTRLRLQAQLEEAREQLKASNDLLIKVRDEHTSPPEDFSGQVRDDADPAGITGSGG